MLRSYTCVWLFFGLLALSAAFSISENSLPENSRNGLANFVPIGGGYYYFEKTSKLNWYAAFEQCRRMGADLVSFETDAEYDAVRRYLDDRNDNSWYWTSGTDLATEGTHIWFANGQPVTIHRWAAGQPDNFDANEDCDQIGFKLVESSVSGLNDAPCSEPMYFICEATKPKKTSIIMCLIYGGCI